MAQTKVYLVNHTHWDREWYFSNQDSRVLSDLLFTDAIKELEKHQSASFTLDGQSSIVEDYLKIRPDMQKRVEALIKAGQLIVGPWYTQPDALHISGESLLRNGIIGKLTAQKYGETADIGYLPDTFGFNAQMPVILNELGLDNFIFWRGIDPKLTGGFYFKWHSLGQNRQVTAINFPQGYGVCKEFAGSKEFVEHSLDPAVKFIEDNSVARPRNVLIPIGNDQMAIKKNFAEQVKQINHLGRI
jgi:Alpha-mannosidase